MAAETTITDLPDAPLPLETTNYVPMDVGATTSKTSLGKLFGEPVEIGSSVPNTGTFTDLQANDTLKLPSLGDGILKNSGGDVNLATAGVDYASPQTVTIVNSAGTTTVLTNASTYFQVVTGILNQIIQLPDETTLTPGNGFQIQNNTTQTVVINDSASTLLYTIPPAGAIRLYTYSAATPTGNWSITVVPPGEMAAGPMRWGTLGLDMVGNPINAAPIGTITKASGAFTTLSYDNASSGIKTTATSGGTLVLTLTSEYYQVFTGTNSHTVQLPDETTIAAGTGYFIQNNSTGDILIRDSASTLLYTVPTAGAVSVYTYSNLTPTGNWAINIVAPARGASGNVEWSNIGLDMGNNYLDNAQIGITTPNFGRFTVASSTVATISQGSLATVGPNTAAVTSDGLYIDVSSTTGVARFSTLNGLTAFNFYTGGIGNTLISSLPNMAIAGVNTSEVWTVSSTPYTLVSQTGAQKIFNTSTNGGVTLPVGTYFFFCEFGVTNLSLTSGAFGFALGGTATIGSQAWGSTTSKGGGLATATQAQLTFSVAANTAISAGNTSQNGVAIIRGIFRLTAAGTVIPQISMQQASAAIIAAGSWFRASPISPSATATTVGNWS
jgi:hypothetical protein